MSLEQKRQHWFDADDNEYYASELRTAAAVYIAALEAELAALKGRRCATCANWNHGHGDDGDVVNYCRELCHAIQRTFGCNRWAERGTE